MNHSQKRTRDADRSTHHLRLADRYLDDRTLAAFRRCRARAGAAVGKSCAQPAVRTELPTRARTSGEHSARHVSADERTDTAVRRDCVDTTPRAHATFVRQLPTVQLSAAGHVSAAGHLSAAAWSGARDIAGRSTADIRTIVATRCWAARGRNAAQQHGLDDDNGTGRVVSSTRCGLPVRAERLARRRHPRCALLRDGSVPRTR